MIIPIRTETAVYRPPTANVVLIGINVLAFAIFHDVLGGGALASFKTEHLYLHSHAPTLLQFFSYQFMHADLWHLGGNMLFLWVFGNPVNGKLGHGPYVLFYLGGGVFAGWGHVIVQHEVSILLGASGAIAAITTAYLVLFPRSHVKVLIWFFIIHIIELPAMLLIVAKIIIWDNMVGPGLTGSGQIAHDAHLAGYLYGFIGALFLLAVRGAPRDQFDLLAVWKRWHQRRSFATVMASPQAAVQAQYGTVARPVEFDPKKRAEEEAKLDAIAELRSRIAEAMERGDVGEGATLYEELSAKSAKQCLSERHQLELARYYYGLGRFEDAADAFDLYVSCYSGSLEADNVRLLLGIIYARDLKNYEAADKHLSAMVNVLRDENRKNQCLEWLRSVRAALGRPAPETHAG